LPAPTPSTHRRSRPNLLKLTLNGSDGDDFIVGSQGDDLINGGRGNDTLVGGTGNDTFVWNPGDGSDIIEGQSGTRYASVQRRQHRRDGRHLGQWQPGAVRT
jgi:hypothetical protein